MSGNKTRRILAIIALVFMAIFSVTLVLTFVSPDMWNGAVAYAALVSGLLGVGLFLVLRFLLKPEESEQESKPDGGEKGEQESEPDDEQK